MNWSNILTKEILTEMYFDKKMNMCEISRHFGCASSTIGRYFKKYEIEKRLDVSLQDIKNEAKLRGGKCLSNTYVNSKSNLKWQCKEGHEWEQTWNYIQTGRWCKRCASIKSNANRKLSIKLFKEIAQNHNGECLSQHYTNNHTKLEFKCEKGHIWESVPKIVKRGSWCKKCSSKIANDPMKLSIDTMHVIAKERGGQCLSKTYVNARTKLKWLCANGHSWEATPHSIKNSGSWCGTCLQLGGLNEEKCRAILEQIFNVKFPKTRKVLGGNLELDGYNEKMRLAFEYQGEQHYYFIKNLHKSKEKFERRVYLDNKKTSLCKEKNINLLIIPYWVGKKDEHLINFIFSSLKNMNISFAIKTNINVHKSGIYESKIKRLHDIALKKGGKCLDTTYKGAREYYTFSCKNGHLWKAKAVDITSQGTWCQKCYGNNKYTIEQMHLFAQKMHGKCISKKYINLTSPLQWKCEHGHKFNKPFVSISSRSTWCTICKNNDKEKIKCIVKDIKLLH